MRIHSDILTHADIYQATRAAGMTGVYTERETDHGSRSRDHAFDVTLRGTSSRRPNWGTGDRGTDDGYAATWDEWGMFIESLFQADENAIIGMYSSYYAFQAYTGYRFDDLTADAQHKSHNFNYSIDTGCHECQCGATMNRWGL